jgi:hypothetical protein
MKEDTIIYGILSLSKKTSLAFILVFISIIIFDSTIVKFSTYSGVNPSNETNIMIFITFSIIFGTSSIILINSVRKITISRDEYQSAPEGLIYFHRVISITQILSFAIILIIISQILILNRYSLTFLEAQVYLSHISALIFLPFLVFLFAGWMLRSKRNYVVILYIISFSLASANLVLSLAYFDSYFSTALPQVRPYPIASYVTNTLAPRSAESLSTTFDALSLSSFLFMWIATAVFLSQYRHKMGKIKYYLLMAIPLVYYIFPLQGYFGDIFFNLLQSSPAATIYSCRNIWQQ